MASEAGRAGRAPRPLSVVSIATMRNSESGVRRWMTVRPLAGWVNSIWDGKLFRTTGAAEPDGASATSRETDTPGSICRASAAAGSPAKMGVQDTSSARAGERMARIASIGPASDDRKAPVSIGRVLLAVNAASDSSRTTIAATAGAPWELGWAGGRPCRARAPHSTRPTPGRRDTPNPSRSPRRSRSGRGGRLPRFAPAPSESR